MTLEEMKQTLDNVSNAITEMIDNPGFKARIFEMTKEDFAKVFEDYGNIQKAKINFDKIMEKMVDKTIEYATNENLENLQNELVKKLMNKDDIKIDEELVADYIGHSAEFDKIAKSLIKQNEDSVKDYPELNFLSKINNEIDFRTKYEYKEQ